jgi:ankyrin repeat protein
MAIGKFELEAKLKDDNQLIRTGVLRNEHPLESSDEFLDFLQACRRGDLKRCQELISAGVNINAKDQYDYTPLVLVSCHQYLGVASSQQSVLTENRPVCAATMSWSNYS